MPKIDGPVAPRGQADLRHHDLPRGPQRGLLVLKLHIRAPDLNRPRGL